MPADYGGTILLIIEDGARRCVISRHTLLRERALPSMRWLERLFQTAPSLSGLPDGCLYFQCEDYALNQLPSIAYGRLIDAPRSTLLVPDAFFLETRGFQNIRSAVEADALPEWSARADRIFWRGSTSHSGLCPDQHPIREPRDIPRVALCLALANSRDADVGLQPWQIGLPPPGEVEDFLRRSGLIRTFVPMLDHARYKFLIDIDGFANAWSLLEKLLLGSCVLKVATPFEQWFYHELEAWVHYVPVRRDLADLKERLDWCLSNKVDAQAIARNGQALALSQTYEAANDVATRAATAAYLPF